VDLLLDLLFTIRAQIFFKMKLLFSLLISLFCVCNISAQNLSITYHADKEILGVPEGVNLPPLSLTGYYFKKGNYIITYLKPNYLN